jgi:hypothetical protein
MRRLTLLTALAATLVLAAPQAPASAHSCARVVTIRGSDSGTFTTEAIDPTHVQTDDVATGRATHIGRYSLHASEVINLKTYDVTDGQYTLTTTHGDTLTGTYAGTAVAGSEPGVITYHVVGPVTGGTGRFAHASGRITFDGIGNLGDGTLSDQLTGWVDLRPARL